MTPEQRRVTIARDVIQSLQGRGLVKLKARQGRYLELANRAKDAAGAREEARETDAEGRPLPEPEAVQVHEEILTAGACAVCAKGAIFVATVLRHDQLTTVDFPEWWRAESNGMFDYLGDFFSREQWDLIENVFEGGQHPESARWCSTVYELSKIKQPKKRMIAIMENIIANGGEFKPKIIPGMEELAGCIAAGIW